MRNFKSDLNRPSRSREHSALNLLALRKIGTTVHRVGVARQREPPKATLQSHTSKTAEKAEKAALEASEDAEMSEHALVRASVFPVTLSNSTQLQNRQDDSTWGTRQKNRVRVLAP